MVSSWYLSRDLVLVQRTEENQSKGLFLGKQKMKYLSSLLRLLVVAGGLLFSPVSGFAETSAAQESTQIAGKVVFLLGRADLVTRDGGVLPVFKNMEIPEESQLLVKEQSHLGLRMIDGGTKQIGPGSVVRISKYDFDSGNPHDDGVNVTVEHGEVTSKTGEVPKTKYRLNTPLAAIGVRGTEFTVKVTRTQTWVTVTEGEIVMARLGHGCSSSALGPCMGSGARTLSESQRGLALVIRENQFQPEMVPVSRPPQGVQNNSASTHGTSSAQTAAVSNAQNAGQQTETKAAGSAQTDSASTANSDKVQQSESAATETTAAPAGQTASTEAGSSTGSQSAQTVADSSTTVNGKTSEAANAQQVVAQTSVAEAESAIVDEEITESPAVTTVVSRGGDEATGQAVETTVIVTEDTETLAVSVDMAEEETVTEWVDDTTDDGLKEIAKVENIADIELDPALDPVANITPEPLPESDGVVLQGDLPTVRWSRWDPDAGVDGLTSFSESVSDQYERILESAPGGYAIEVLDGSVPVAAERGEFSLEMGSYEASVINSATGDEARAIIDNGRLTVDPAANTFSTGFDYNSALHDGSVAATGVYDTDTGVIMDDRSIPETRIEGAIRSVDGVAGGAYEFSHQIDVDLSVEGAIDWSEVSPGE